MPRKTVNVATVKASVNNALTVTYPGNTPDYRRGVAAVLETILMDTGNYKGFRFTDGNKGHTDETRREYY